ncbi:hypothetical protein D082_22080 [Synechocystis sp. PCC 6714]|nr:hypothetical protein D082_22080 [Synechocystis sp. PCC 6714]
MVNAKDNPRIRDFKINFIGNTINFSNFEEFTVNYSPSQ